MIVIESMTIYEFTSLIIGTIGVVGLIATIWFLLQQTKEMTSQTRFVAESMKNSGFENIRISMMKINEIFITYPELRPYFYTAKEATDNNELLEHRLAAVSESLLDLFESLLLYHELFPDIEIWPKDEWDAYMRSIFAKSPILCRYLENTKEWYIQELMDIMREGVAKRPLDKHFEISQVITPFEITNPRSEAPLISS